MAKYKVGDKVRVRSDLEVGRDYNGIKLLNGYMSKCVGRTGIILDITDIDDYISYRIDSNAFTWSEEMLEPADIWRKEIKCIIHTSTQEEADMLFKSVDSYDHKGTIWASWWNVYKEKTCYRTNLGEVVAYGCIDNYIEDGEKVIEFSDLVATGGYCNGFKGGKIPTPSKPVSIEEQLGLPKGVSIHDLPTSEWYNPVRFDLPEFVFDAEQAKEYAENIIATSELISNITGISNEDSINKLKTCLSASSNDGISTKNGGKNSMKFTFYVTEGTRVDKSCNGTIPTMTTNIELLSGNAFDGVTTVKGSATCDKADYDERQGVLEALANMYCDGDFDKAFNKAVKRNEFTDKKKRTCTYCGKVFDTVEEKQAEEAWHVERKKARRERYLLRKRAKEIAFEEQAQKMAKEMIEK